MKKMCVALSVLVIAVVMFTAGISAAPVKSKTPDVKVSETSVQNPVSQPSTEKILESRFLNMLNHNYVYCEDFDTAKAIVDSSVIALLDLRDSEDDSFIAENYVADFIYDMYGIEGIELDALNPEFANREGYVYILPRGYSSFSHSIKNVVVNEDGSYTVETNVQISNHDNTSEQTTCTTLFVKNENSAFGYNIIYSELADLVVTV